MAEQSSSPVGPDLADAAVALAGRWVLEAADEDVDPAAERLAGVLQDPAGLPFTLGFVDGVMRPESASAAASNLHRVAPLAPDFLPWYLRGVVRLGGVVAPVLPVPTVPIARRVLREMVGHLIVDARPDKLGPALQKIRGPQAEADADVDGRTDTRVRLNLNLLGEAVLGEAEAKRRLDGIHDLIRRDDVDYVSVKVSAIMSRISMWAFGDVVTEVVDRLLPLYVTAASNQTFINLDMEEYRDLDLTVAVFTRLLEDPRLKDSKAGIVLQTYLPDALPALRELTAWARDRVDHGGAPIKVRLVKGANLAMERVDALMHGWPQAPYTTKLDTDANYLRCLDEAFTPRNAAAVRIGVAGHNLFDIAYAWLLAGERAVRDSVEFEMLLGMAQGQVAAVAREVGGVLLYVPVVNPAEFDVAISYLVRRLDENASQANFLSAAFHLADDPSLFERERLRFVDSLSRRDDRTLHTGPRRTQNRNAPAHESVRPLAHRAQPDEGLTGVVLDIARGSNGDDGDGEDDPFLQTAVYARQELAAAVGAAGAPGFENTPDSDPALPANREWANGILSRVADPDACTLGLETVRAGHINDEQELTDIIERVRAAGAQWGARPAAERAEILQRAAAALAARRGDLIEIAAVETGKVFAEADIEVSEAVDFAKYYASRARELDAVSGARFEPAQVTVVTPPWNFPLAIPAGGVLAALAAGSGVIFKPAHLARRCAAVIAEALWQAGVPRDVLSLVDLGERELGQQLISHSSVDRVILTGAWDTAALFRSWRPDLPLLAETSGKNAIIITPTADLDLAVADLVRSAFGHAGQKCSAASLVILVGAVGHSKRFARQLTDAVRSMRVAWPADATAEIGPVIGPPQGKLAWALSELERGEKWLIRPQLLDDVVPCAPEDRGRLWSPGVRVGVLPGSRTHLEEFFGPMMGVMHAATLSEAIALQNAVAYGLTAGLHTQDPAELELWLDEVQAGNLYVNRGITGAIVQRQPFGGWKRSSVGPGAKAGGPNYLIGLGTWRSQTRGTTSSTLHLRGLDTRISTLIEAAQPSLGFEDFEWLRQSALSDAVAWDREFGQVRDVSQLEVERNLFRYRPVPVIVRAASDAGLHEVLRVVLAGIRSGARFVLSVPTGLPAGVRGQLSDLDVLVAVESDGEWIDRMSRRGEAAVVETDESSLADAGRVRLIGERDAVAALHADLARAVGGDPDLAIYDNEVTSAGRIELLPFVHEQAISITAHRFGDPDDWSAAVI